MTRPNKHMYYLNIAHEVAKRGTCLRRNYGAVIVNNDQIVSTGYTGAPRGLPNCTDRGTCLREELKVKPGENYELCRSVHAEMNACLQTGREKCIGAALYLEMIESPKDNGMIEGSPRIIPEPCRMCKRVIINCGITTVVTKGIEAKAVGNREWVVVTYVKEWIDTNLYEL